MTSSSIACELCGLQLVFVHPDHRFSGFLFISYFLTIVIRFAVCNKINPIKSKAEVEKAFTKLRWKREFERDIESADEDSEDEPEFFDSARKCYDLERIRPISLRFNKKVFMPPYSDKETETKI